MAYLELDGQKEIFVIMDPDTDSGIRKIWGKAEEDIRRITGAMCRPACQEGTGNIEQAVIVAVWGKGSLSKRLGERIGGLDRLQGRREAYGFYLADHPVEGVERGLIICGSDKLGIIYGIFHLSELLGATPWTFWGDAPLPFHQHSVLCTEIPKKREGQTCYIECNSFISKEPSVKYRGFFINDEWPCFENWTFSHYQGFTAEMYDKVFEYLLRMKGNYIWPAMWTSSFMLDGPGMASMELADEYGIYVGMSHHEPCMRSSEEWDICKGEDTPYGTQWSYVNNKEGLLRYWEDGIIRSKGHQVFPTLGMRGERDSKMLGEDSDIEENVRLLKEIIKKQRQMIRKHLGRDADKTPLLFAVYKEVEDYYFGGSYQEGLNGFEELDGVTLLLCEDNFGNMRALPEKEERARSGGFGMYYHLDYHGAPVSYEWQNSTPVCRIWEQMTQAYEYGIRDLWIVNVGDLKFQEYPLGYFMELAYDYENWGTGCYDRSREYTAVWVQKIFGSYAKKEQVSQIAWVLKETAGINSLRRPEACSSGVYHPVHYHEGRRMLKRLNRLEEVNEEVWRSLEAEEAREAYYSMIYYPAAASANLLKMHLYAGFNHLYASQGKAMANVYGEWMDTCILRDEELAREFSAFKGGRWKGMEMAPHIGFTNWNSEDWRYPVRHVLRLPGTPRLVVSAADSEKYYTNQYFPVPFIMEDFLYPGCREITLQVANGGQGRLAWRIEERCEYLSFSACEGSTEMEDEIRIRISLGRLPKEEQKEFCFHIRHGEESLPVVIRAKRRDITSVPRGAFMDRDGVYVLDAVDYLEQAPGIFEGHRAVFEKLEGYGKYGTGVKVFPETASFEGEENAPCLVYGMWADAAGSCRLELHTSPANPLRYAGSLRLGVSVNEEEVRQAYLVGGDYRGGDHTCAEWAKAVLDQEHVCRMGITLKQGMNYLRIYGQDAGVVLERLVICREEKELLSSYLGPDKTYCRI